MNKLNGPDPGLDNLLQRTFKDDLPPEAEAGMNQRFLSLKRAIDKTGQLPEADRRVWVRGLFRKEILAAASVAMIILGLVMQLGGSQSALAHSIGQLKVILSISAGLDRAASMECVVQKPGAEGAQTTYRVRWRATGDVRVDMDSAGGGQTLWILNETISVAGPGRADVRSMPINTMPPGPEWQPVLEFLSPEILARRMEQHYGLMRSRGRSGAGAGDFLIAGREGSEDVEVTVNAATFLPRTLKKYSHDSDRASGARRCVMEVRFLWNQPAPAELFIPQTPDTDHKKTPEAVQP
jgi:hypothetical protein